MKSPHTRVPKWTTRLPSDMRRQLHEFGTKTFFAVLEAQQLRGKENQAARLSRWLQQDADLLADFAHGMIDRIVCTEPSERQTEEQQTILAIMALRDTVDSIEQQQPHLTEGLERRLDRQADSFKSVASEMARACGKLWWLTRAA